MHLLIDPPLKYILELSLSVTYNLVRHACHVTGFSVWMEDVPFHFFDAYQVDLPVRSLSLNEEISHTHTHIYIYIYLDYIRVRFITWIKKIIINKRLE